MRVLALVCSLFVMTAVSAHAQEEPELTPPVDIAQMYIQAVYDGDAAIRDSLAPWWAANHEGQVDDEARTTLESIEARPLTREEAQDYDPFSEKEYAEVKTRFSFENRHGTATYLIGMLPRPDGRVVRDDNGHATNLMVYMQNGGLNWAPPAQ
jgi:hypothetical protein